jgi:hypothetical protein
LLAAKILPLLATVPPQSMRFAKQHAFACKAFAGMTTAQYYASRSLKYAGNLQLKPLQPQQYAAWLTGFIEAKAIFAVRTHCPSMRICLQADCNLLTAILQFLQQPVKFSNKRGVLGQQLHCIEIASAAGFAKLCKLLQAIPLQGEAYVKLATCIQLGQLQHG